MNNTLRKRAIQLCAAFTILVIAVFGYTKVMAHVGSGNAPVAAASTAQADMIIVSKNDHTLYLLRNGSILQTYNIAMGARWDAGHKTRAGDERTPEGRYVIDWRNGNSIANLSLHISYPNKNDRDAAQGAGVDPGGNIMFHGLPNGWGALAPFHLLTDWKDGYIAVTNAEMQQIWALVPDGTPIEIYPVWSLVDNLAG